MSRFAEACDRAECVAARVRDAVSRTRGAALVCEARFCCARDGGDAVSGVSEGDWEAAGRALEARAWRRGALRQAQETVHGDGALLFSTLVCEEGGCGAGTHRLETLFSEVAEGGGDARLLVRLSVQVRHEVVLVPSALAPPRRVRIRQAREYEAPRGAGAAPRATLGLVWSGRTASDADAALSLPPTYEVTLSDESCSAAFLDCAVQLANAMRGV